MNVNWNRLLSTLMVVFCISGLVPVTGNNLTTDGDFEFDPSELNDRWPSTDEYIGADFSANDKVTDGLYYANYYNFIRWRTHDIINTSISDLNDDGVLQFDYKVASEGIDIFGIELSSSSGDNLLLMVSDAATEGPSSRLVSTDVTVGSWKHVSINPYNYWVDVGFASDGIIIHLSIYIEDRAANGVEGNTEFYLDNIELNDFSSSGGGGGSGGTYFCDIICDN